MSLKDFFLKKREQRSVSQTEKKPRKNADAMKNSCGDDEISEAFESLLNFVFEKFPARSFPGGFNFDIPGTDNKALLQVIPDAIEKTNLCFQIGVHRGYDMLVSNFWKRGTEEEIREYLG